MGQDCIPMDEIERIRQFMDDGLFDDNPFSKGAIKTLLDKLDTVPEPQAEQEGE